MSCCWCRDLNQGLVSSMGTDRVGHYPNVLLEVTRNHRCCTSFFRTGFT